MCGLFLSLFSPHSIQIKHIGFPDPQKWDQNYLLFKTDFLNFPIVLVHLSDWIFTKKGAKMAEFSWKKNSFTKKKYPKNCLTKKDAKTPSRWSSNGLSFTARARPGNKVFTVDTLSVPKQKRPKLFDDSDVLEKG